MNKPTPQEEEEKSKSYSFIPLQSLLSRPRRNRKNRAIRALVEEHTLTPSHFVVPQFLVRGRNRKEVIPSLPGVYRLSLDLLAYEVEKLLERGIPALALFPVIPPEEKDAMGLGALDPKGLTQQAVRFLKSRFPSLCLITDVALDPYTSHGHDGILNAEGEVDNEETVSQLVRMALVQAEAGADIVAPSDMMDGRVRALREGLDRAGFTQVNILSYSVKYASSLYSPFREALGSSLAFGDKKSYQMDPANSREALREVALDEAEGADMLMIKPALSYLDIIAKVRAATLLPLAAYHVSGEYAMVMAAAEKGWIDADSVFWEHLVSIKRAGADIIFSYAALRIVDFLRKG